MRYNECAVCHTVFILYPADWLSLNITFILSGVAKLKGVLKITGKLGGLSFYEMKGKIIVRKPGGFDGIKIRTEEKFVNVRNNASEFGRCSKFGGKLRRVLQPFLGDLKETHLHGRMAKMLHEIMKMDRHSEKGARTVQTGLQTDEGKKVLASFGWNVKDGKRCRYKENQNTLYFDHVPRGSKKAEVTLRFINPNDGAEALEFVESVFEVALPCAEFRIPEGEPRGTGPEHSMKFALIRFFDKNNVKMEEKTAVVVG